MASYQYTFDNTKPRKKFTCPECGKPKVFTRYIDTITSEYLPDKYGKCDRVDNCTYHLNPYKDGYNKTMKEQEKKEVRHIFKHQSLQKVSQDKISFIQPDIFKQSLQCYEQNNFVLFLLYQFGKEITEQLTSKYYIGTSKHWIGATIFWQADILSKIRTGKIILYNSETGKRSKDTKPPVQWVHGILKLKDFNLKQCFFGEHLLKHYPLKPVAIVESEKTAIISSVYLPQFIWLSCGSKEGLNKEKCKILKGRNVTLYPDLNGFDKWSNKAKELFDITRFSVSNLLETKASEAEKKQGLDLADYLIKFPLPEHNKAPKDLLKLLIEKCVSMSKKCMSGEITKHEYSEYSKGLANKLTEAKIPFDEFVKLTKDL